MSGFLCVCDWFLFRLRLRSKHDKENTKIWLNDMQQDCCTHTPRNNNNHSSAFPGEGAAEKLGKLTSSQILLKAFATNVCALATHTHANKSCGTGKNYFCYKEIKFYFLKQSYLIFLA